MIDHQPAERTWLRSVAVWGLWLAVLALAAVVCYVIWLRAFFRDLLCVAQSGRRSPMSLRTHDGRTDRGHGHMDRRG